MFHPGSLGFQETILTNAHILQLGGSTNHQRTSPPKNLDHQVWSDSGGGSDLQDVSQEGRGPETRFGLWLGCMFKPQAHRIHGTGIVDNLFTS